LAFGDESCAVVVEAGTGRDLGGETARPTGSLARRRGSIVIREGLSIPSRGSISFWTLPDLFRMIASDLKHSCCLGVNVDLCYDVELSDVSTPPVCAAYCGEPARLDDCAQNYEVLCCLEFVRLVIFVRDLG